MILCALVLLLQNGWALGDEPETLLWPIGDGVTPATIHQSYGQAEVSGSVHLHAGLDLVPKVRVAGKGNLVLSPDDLPDLPMDLLELEDRTVWSLEDGTVVRIDLDLAGGGKKAGLVVASKTKPGRAFLYMHLEPASIELLVGDEVEADEALGEVRLEDPTTDYPEHLHLSRLQGPYLDESIAWSMLETLSIRNPLVLIAHDLHEDDQAPEIALDAGKMFRRNEALADPTLLSSAAVQAPVMLDILAQVKDNSHTSGPLAPHSLQLTIETDGMKDRFALILDGPLPLSSDVLYDEKNCIPAACAFVLTNGSSASFAMDKLFAWCASAGKHKLELTAWDAAGNKSTASHEFEVPH